MPNLSRLLVILVTSWFTANTWAISDLSQIIKSAPKITQNPVTETTQLGETTASVVVEPPKVDIVESKAAPRKTKRSRCQGGDINTLQKSLLITAFPQLQPTHANAGALSDAEHQLPLLISQELVSKRSTLEPLKFKESLANPATSTDKLLSQQIQKLAWNQGAQLVLSGEIVDMSMRDINATYDPRTYTRIISSLYDVTRIKTRFDRRDRLFSFQLTLRDGFTGQSLFSQRYNTYGIWNSTQKIGFGSPQFWKTDYGQQIKGTIKKAADELNDVIQCQPYIVQVESRPGQTHVLLQGGANNGLHAGDTLSLYQLVVQGSESEYEQHNIRLVNRNAAIELHEVYPSHSVGVINSSTYLTGQFLAISP